jgi:adenylate cyclase
MDHRCIRLVVDRVVDVPCFEEILAAAGRPSPYQAELCRPRCETESWASGRSGWIEAYRGQPRNAIEHFQIARTLAPDDSLSFLWAIGIGAAHFEAARYDQAIGWFERGLAERPTAVWNHRFLVPAYILAGGKDEARRRFAEFARAFPDLTIAEVKAGLPYTAGFLDRVAEGLETVGMRIS